MQYLGRCFLVTIGIVFVISIVWIYSFSHIRLPATDVFPAKKILSPLKIIEGDVRATDDVRVHYWFYDRGTAVVTIFFHGGVCGSSEQFRLMGADAYAEKFGSILMFDERGCGKSQLQVPKETINPARLALDVDELRAKIIPGSPVVIFGRSYGGVLATLYATSHPQNVVGALLVVPGYFDFSTNTKGMTEIDTATNERILQEELDFLKEHYYAKLSEVPENQNGAEESSGGMTEAYFSNLTVTTENHEPWLDALSDIPTLVISGEFDTRVPPLAIEHMKPHLPNATFVEIPNSGHYNEYTHADEFTRAVAAWWDGAKIERK
jgi:pimeloyl-ACP methyl ester carboxylesterase